MKAIKILFTGICAAILVAGCKMPEHGISKDQIFYKNVFINAFDSGAILSIISNDSSIKADFYIENMSSQKAITPYGMKHYFGFYVYYPTKILDPLNPILTICNSPDIKVSKKEVGGQVDYQLYQYSSIACSRSRNYAIVRNGEITRIESSQDTKDYPALEKVLENLHF